LAHSHGNYFAALRLRLAVLRNAGHGFANV